MGRVLIVHPYRNVGGPDTFVTNIVRCLVSRGFQFWVLVAEERSLAQRLRELGAVVLVEPALQTLPRTLSPIRLGRHLVTMRRAALSVRTIVEREAISVVHAVHETMWPVLARLRDDGVARVVSVHGLRFATPAWAGRLNTRMLAAAADRIICVSDVVRQVFRNWNVPERKLALVPSSVDLGRFHPDVSGHAFRRELGIALDAPLVGTVGSVDERKGLTYFLDACAWLRTRYPDARFVVVGPVEDGAAGASGPVAYVQHLRARATALDLSNCLSFVPARPDIPNVMAALDILVQPSLTEAGPRAPLEAMAMMRPVVGTRVEGTAEEIVEGETGILVEPRDGIALARAVSALLDDPVRRERMGRAGRARVEKFYSLATTAEVIEGVYRNASRQR